MSEWLSLKLNYWFIKTKDIIFDNSTNNQFSSWLSIIFLYFSQCILPLLSMLMYFLYLSVYIVTLSWWKHFLLSCCRMGIVILRWNIAFEQFERLSSNTVIMLNCLKCRITKPGYSIGYWILQITPLISWSVVVLQTTHYNFWKRYPIN